MVEAVMLWNEPNNLSHWDFHLDPEWKHFAALVHADRAALSRPFFGGCALLHKLGHQRFQVGLRDQRERLFRLKPLREPPR